MSKLHELNSYILNRDNLTLWMNNLLVLYAFLLPISQTIKATVFIFITLLFILRGNVFHYIKESLKNRVVQAFLYLFLIYMLGLFWSEDLQRGFSDLKSVKYGLYLIIFYAIIDGRYINKVITAFILGMLISELVSYGLLLGVMPWRLEIGDILFYATQTIGDPSPFLNHIHYGVALSFTVVLLGQKIYYSQSNLVMKLLMSFFVLSATANIFITGGRTGYVTFVLLVVTLGVFYLKRYAIFAILFILLVLSIAYNSSDIFHAKIQQTKKSLNSISSTQANFSTSLGQRAGIYYYGFEVIKKSPLFGVGTGDSMNEIHKITPKKWSEIHLMKHEHNQFFSIFVKLGLVGLIVFLNIYYQIFRYKQEQKELRFIMIFATLAIGFGLLSTQFNLRFFLPLWVLMLSLTMISYDRKTFFIQFDERKELFKIVGAGAVFAISSLVYQLL